MNHFNRGEKVRLIATTDEDQDKLDRAIILYPELKDAELEVREQLEIGTVAVWLPNRTDNSDYLLFPNRLVRAVAPEHDTPASAADHW